jgi:hypothetical protein
VLSCPLTLKEDEPFFFYDDNDSGTPWEWPENSTFKMFSELLWNSYVEPTLRFAFLGYAVSRVCYKFHRQRFLASKWYGCLFQSYSSPIYSFFIILKSVEL